MIDGFIEGLRGRIVGEPQDVAAAKVGQPAGAGNEQKAQGAHAADQVAIGAFARPGFGGRKGVELEAANQVVGEDAELLPGAVGAVVPRGDDVEGELALELGDGFLLGPPAGGEIPERWAAESLVGGDDGVTLRGTGQCDYSEHPAKAPGRAVTMVRSGRERA